MIILSTGRRVFVISHSVRGFLQIDEQAYACINKIPILYVKLILLLTLGFSYSKARLVYSKIFQYQERERNSFAHLLLQIFFFPQLLLAAK